jgi:VirE N-terminal domain
MLISLYNNAQSPTPIKDISVQEALGYIKNNYDNTRYILDFLRAETDKKKRTELKKGLKAVTWSGYFTKRNADSLIEHSGIICIDLDDLPNVQETKKLFCEDAYTYSCFISPSGTGLKVLYTVDADNITHPILFNAIASYITNTFGVVVDASGKDVCRLCFLSHDPEIFINENSTICSYEFVGSQQTEIVANSSNNNTQPVSTGITDVWEMCHQITSKMAQAVSGQYNKYIINYARYACRYGLAESDTTDKLISECSAHSAKETKASVKGVYVKFASEFNTWEFKKPKEYTTNYEYKNLKKNNTATVTPTNIYNDDIQFWYEVENEKTKKVEYKFSYDDGINFLHNNGFYKYPLDNGYYQFIHVREDIKQVEVIQGLQIKEFFINYLKSQPSGEFKAVREMFRRGAKNYCSSSQLEGLDYFKPVFKKDAKDTAFVYFKNCFLKITATEIVQHNYKNLDGYIWSKQVIDFDYIHTDYELSDFARFVFLVMVGEKKPLDQCTEIELKKIESFKSTMGYLLHRYKNPALTKAVVAVDKRLRSAGENNGRTGKSLLSKALAKMLNVCGIDGKLFGFEKPFPFQRANIDTELINFNDIKKNFDFECLFGMITEEFTFEKKGKDSITLPFEDAPKFYISTNTTLKGSGESNKGRQQIIEFGSYFNTEHTPVKEFGKMFFSDWTAQDYAMFYTYMVDCIKHYLCNSLIDFPLENYELNKLIDTAGEEFIDYMDEIVLAQLKYVQEYDNHKLLEGYTTTCTEKYREKTSIKTFNKYVKAWADIKGLVINGHRPDGRDKRNNTTYLTFTHLNTTTENELIEKSSLPF